MVEKIQEAVGEQFDRSGGVPGGAPWEREWREYEEIHFGRPVKAVTEAPTLAENRVNHLKNLYGAQGVDGYTGFYHGTFFLKGVPRSKRR